LSLFLMVCIKELFRLKEKYPFPRPPTCLRKGCGSTRLWGHGFKDAYYDGYSSALPQKRYICADCGCVYTLRPFGYWPRHHSSAVVILSSMCKRIREGAWRKDNVLSRQRRQHWLRALGRNIKAYLGIDFEGDYIWGFYELVHRGRIPIARAG
jgi:hypothetical protein